MQAGHNSAPSSLAAIRAKAERIVSLLSKGNDDADTLSLAEELAQEIADICPVCGGTH